jgi:hypothetical protein
MKWARVFSLVGLIFLVVLLLFQVYLKPNQPTRDIETSATDTVSTYPTQTLATNSSLSVTPILTLESEAAREHFYNLTNMNPGCLFPCWWNVTPGETRIDELLAQWRPLAGLAQGSQFSTQGALNFSIPDGDIEVVLQLRYATSGVNRIVDEVKIITRADRDTEDGYIAAYGDEGYEYLLKNLTLQGVLAGQGAPSNIFVSMSLGIAEPDAPSMFRIWLVYTDRGALIEFSGFAQVNGSEVIYCPQLSFLQAWLIPKGDSVGIENLLSSISGLDWAGMSPPSPDFSTIEEASGVSLNEFLETYTTETSDCLSTPLLAWPP